MLFLSDYEQTDLALDAIVGLALEASHGCYVFLLVFILWVLLVDLLV